MLRRHTGANGQGRQRDGQKYRRQILHGYRSLINLPAGCKPKMVDCYFLWKKLRKFNKVRRAAFSKLIRRYNLRITIELFFIL